MHEEPLRALARYLTNRGDYSWRPGLRTPLGVRPVLTSYLDGVTVLSKAVTAESLRSVPVDVHVGAFVYEDKRGRTRWSSTVAAL